MIEELSLLWLDRAGIMKSSLLVAPLGHSSLQQDIQQASRSNSINSVDGFKGQAKDCTMSVLLTHTTGYNPHLAARESREWM